MAYLAKGLEKAKLATAKDDAEEYEEALILYKTTAEYLLHASKYEAPNKITKEQVERKCLDYIKRAEQIKKMLDSQQKEKSNSGGQAMRKQGKDTKGSDDNEESSRFKSSLQGAIVVEKPNIKWEDVIGLDGAKEALKETVIFPVKFPNVFTGKRSPWKGILLYGPPGTGKSFLAKAVATEAGESTFLSVSSADLVSKWVGESEKLVRTLFEMARERKPSIVFIDEIDSICGSRSDTDSESGRRIKNEFLVQMSGVGVGDNSGVLVLGATNIPWSLDSAIRRRFEKRIFIPLPEAPERTQMFKTNLGPTRHTITEQHFATLGQQTVNYSGADISIVVRDALMMPIRKAQAATHFKVYHPGNGPSTSVTMYTPCSPDDPEAKKMSWLDLANGQLQEPPVTMMDMMQSLHNNKPTVNDADLQRLKQFTDDFGQDGA